MKSRNYSLFLFSLCALVVLATSPLCAQTRVGEAAVVKKEVLRVAGSATSQINVGDGLLRDEVVRTGLDSATRLVMADSTNLSLGPSASLKLDRTVFDDEHHYRDVAVRLSPIYSSTAPPDRSRSATPSIAASGCGSVTRLDAKLRK